jgi:hypothetical protein
MQQPMPNMAQPMVQSVPQQIQQPIPQPIQPVGLQGKSVDSVDVVKAMDIPLDGSVSYFPLTDGTAIVTKQLQQDGTSKTLVYKPVEENQKENITKYVTVQELNEAMKNIPITDVTSIEEEISNIKSQLNDVKKILVELKERKK